MYALPVKRMLDWRFAQGEKMKNLFKPCHLIKSTHLLHRACSYTIIILVTVLFVYCNDESKKINSQIDKSRGYWIQKTDYLFQYRISNREKSIILKEYEYKNENWRTSKETVALFYLSDIDSQFSAIGGNIAKIAYSGNSILINQNGKSYRIILENYKSIYFPISIERERI
jgi:hypothetical protein